MTYIGSRLRYLREQDHITQQQLADSIGVAKSTISMYENGLREPDFEKIEAIADFFNVDMRTFFPGETPGAILSSFPLSAQEKEVIIAYRAASIDDRAIIDNIVRRYTQDIKKQNLA